MDGAKPGYDTVVGKPSRAFCRFLREYLARWFTHNCRSFPWRADRDPYRIWVSEVMLQQTQAATVIPFFNRFLKALPTIADLAAADEADVLRLWEGLGYYRRARDLHAAARQLVHENGGSFPDDPRSAARLPGIGRYMVGAILSQAYERRLPILEVNSQRVLCRLLGIRGDPRRGSLRRSLWDVAEHILPQRQIGQFNQALMELGATICRSVSPECGSCPVARLCAARQQGIQAEIPPPADGPTPVRVREAGVVVRRYKRVLLVQRPSRGRWASLWEFPHVELHKLESSERGGARLLGQLLGIQADLGPTIATLRHSVTHHRISLVVFEARYRSGEFRSPFYSQAHWIAPKLLPTYPLSAPQRRLAKALLGPVRAVHDRDGEAL